MYLCAFKVHTTNFPGNYPGFDDTWNIQKFKKVNFSEVTCWHLESASLSYHLKVKILRWSLVRKRMSVLTLWWCYNTLVCEIIEKDTGGFNNLMYNPQNQINVLYSSCTEIPPEQMFLIARDIPTKETKEYSNNGHWYLIMAIFASFTSVARSDEELCSVD